MTPAAQPRLRLHRRQNGRWLTEDGLWMICRLPGRRGWFARAEWTEGRRWLVRHTRPGLTEDEVLGHSDLGALRAETRDQVLASLSALLAVDPPAVYPARRPFGRPRRVSAGRYVFDGLHVEIRRGPAPAPASKIFTGEWSVHPLIDGPQIGVWMFPKHTLAQAVDAVRHAVEQGWWPPTATVND